MTRCVAVIVTDPASGACDVVIGEVDERRPETMTNDLDSDKTEWVCKGLCRDAAHQLAKQVARERGLPIAPGFT